MNEAKCRVIVRARSNEVCEICGQARANTMHHRKNRSQGGPWTPSNILHLCGDGTTGCHGMVTDTRPEFYDYGWCVKSWQEPGEVPADLNHGTVLLDDAGGMTTLDGAA